MGYYLGVLVKGLMIGSIEAAFLDGNSFNYMLVAMALGGTFLVPSLRSAAAGGGRRGGHAVHPRRRPPRSGDRRASRPSRCPSA